MHNPVQPQQGLVFSDSAAMLQGRVFSPRGREVVQAFPLLVGNQVLSFMDFYAQTTNPAAPPAGMARFHSATTQGFTRFEQDNEAPTNLVLGRDNVFIARNTSGSNIAAGKPVYITGSTGNVPNVALAKADSLTTLPAVGMTLDPINNNNFGQVMRLGVIGSIDTSAFSTETLLYVSSTSAGALTATRPVSPAYAQPIANVLVSGVGNGSLHVMAAPFVGGQDTGTDAAAWKFNGHTLSLPADASVSGTNTGDQTVSVVAPLAGGGSGSTISVTTSMNTGKLLGRSTAGVGVMEELVVGGGLTLAGGTLSASGGLTTSEFYLSVDVGTTYTIDAGYGIVLPGPYVVNGTLVTNGIMITL